MRPIALHSGVDKIRAFLPRGEARMTKDFSTAELALRDVAGVPLPADFAGANRVDGCFAE